jgi:hypothetical protein
MLKVVIFLFHTENIYWRVKYILYKGVGPGIPLVSPGPLGLTPVSIHHIDPARDVSKHASLLIETI